jgi:hypothetical protein
VLGPSPPLPSLFPTFPNSTTCSGRTQQQRRTAARHAHNAESLGPDRRAPQADPAGPATSTHRAALIVVVPDVFDVVDCQTCAAAMRLLYQVHVAAWQMCVYVVLGY